MNEYIKEQLMEAYKRGSRDVLDSAIKSIETAVIDGASAMDVVTVLKAFRKSL